FEAPQRPLSVAMLADTRGRDGQLAAMLEKIDQELRGRDAKVTAADVRGSRATVYTLPRKQGQLVVENLVILVLDGRLIISDRLETVNELAAAAQEGRTDGLEQSKDFQAVFSQSDAAHQKNAEAGAAEADTADEDAAAGDAAPSVLWFARPIGMGMIAR